MELAQEQFKNLNDETSKFRLAEDGCASCTMEHGTYLKPNFEFGVRTVENFIDSLAPICSGGNQCVASGAGERLGCCQPCKTNQLCAKGTISFGGIQDAARWNLCPPGFICDSFTSDVAQVIKKCEAGTICEMNKKRNCTDLRQQTIDEGFGDIHAGTYCPEGEFRMMFCPQGYYCNSTNMTEKYLCPAGKFCPLKTETPEISCPGCEEGAKVLKTDPFAATAILLPLCLLLIITSILKWYRPKIFTRHIQCCNELEQITNEPKHETAAKVDLDALRISMNIDQMMMNVEEGRRANFDEARIITMISSIQQRVAKISDSSSDSSLLSANIDLESHNVDHIDDKQQEQTLLGTVIDFFKGGNNANNESSITFENFPPIDEESSKQNNGAPSYLSFASGDFDAELVFNKLDTNRDNVLSYDELNAILKLNEVKLKYFVRKMNKLEGAAPDKTTISKECFLNHFYETLVNTESFDPDFNEAAEIFDAVDVDSDGIIKGIDLYSPILSNILTDRQIHVMMKKMKKEDEKGNESIEKETFINMYPLLLSEVILNSPLENGSAERGVDITFSDLSLTVNVQGQPMHCVNSIGGRIREKTMTAIMGGSGTGKTSLLNSLCGKAFYGKVSGTVLLNGKKAKMEDHKHLMGFVPQDDIMYAELTVRENLIFAGRFKLPPSTPLKEIRELADDVIVSLGLIRVRNRVVGDVRRRGISGGEKKRVNIGLELMGKPRILFLDEPTSGLDASSSSLVMASLKSLVREDGVTCVSVIHQPRKFIFDLLDNVILLSFGGRIVYHGSPAQSITYFEEIGYKLPNGENAADWLLDISSGQLGFPASYEIEEKSITGLPTGENLKQARDFLFEKWEEHILALSEEDMESFLLPPIPFEIPPQLEKPSFFSQLKTQIERNLVVMSRNRMTILLDTSVILFAITIISLIDGKAELVDPRFINMRVGTRLSDLLKFPDLSYQDMNFPFLKAALNYQGDAIKIAVVCSVLLGLNATKVMSEKRLEFFRETSSGYNINAYFMAVNITSTIENSAAMMLAAIISILVRSTISSWGTVFLNFVMLGWGCASWSLLFSIIIPSKNLIVVTGFFMSFFSILLGGAIPPFEFSDIYDSPMLQLICGFFSPARFFIETFTASDFRCLPQQTSFTREESAINARFSGFDAIRIGLHDENVSTMSCSGWFYYFPAAFCCGLTIRVLAAILLHTVNRSKLSRRSIQDSLFHLSFQLQAIFYIGVFLSFLALSSYLILF